MATAAPETGLGRGAERRVYAVMFLAYLAIGAIGPLLPEIRRAFGASVGEVGMAISAFGLARLLIDLPAGGLSERFGYRRLLLVGTLLLVAASLASAFADRFAVVALACSMSHHQAGYRGGWSGKMASRVVRRLRSAAVREVSR